MKLDICGGTTKLFKDFLNVDGRPGSRTDIVADIRKPLPFKDGEIEEIFSCATLEHLLFIQTERLIGEFSRILQPGGKLTIAVPDLKKICHSYVDGTLPYPWIVKYIYGELTESSVMEFDCHKSAYDFNVLSAIIRNSGFRDIEEVEYDLPMHRKDLMFKIICYKI